MSTITDLDKIYETYAKHLVMNGNKSLSALAAGVEADTVDVFLENADSHPEVIRVLAEEECLIPNFDDPSSVRGAILSKLWKEANYKGAGGNQTARITALKHIGEITGIEAPKKVDLNTGQGGLMLVPVMGNDEWETTAAIAQEKLKATARD